LAAAAFSLALVFGQDVESSLEPHRKALEANPSSSLAHYRMGEIYFKRGKYVEAVNAFRAALNGDLEPPWVKIWAHVNLGKIFDATGQRERALNEYRQAARTKDNTRGALEEAAKYLQSPYQRPRDREQKP
jgi:tetratricopeptide (TPR) repeat protein